MTAETGALCPAGRNILAQTRAPQLPIKNASFPEPFAPGLEFSAPARGKWNIVHTAMLVPEAHQIFVCARGCLRGVVLTATEMNAMERMSWVGLSEEDLACGDLEQSAIEGISEILARLERLGKLPPIVLLFLSCVHRFAGFDFSHVLRSLAAAWPRVRFVDCYMNPTMRKSELPEDPTMRRQLYAALDRAEALDPKSVNLIGNDRPTEARSEFLRFLRENGFIVRDLCACESLAEYRDMAKSSLNITYLPEAIPAGEALQTRLGQRHVHLPLCYDTTTNRANLQQLAQTLHLPAPDTTNLEAEAEQALAAALAHIGATPITLDYTATPRPLGLARLLVTHNFRVATVYADSFIADERSDFLWLQENAPEIILSATVHPEGRFRFHQERGSGDKTLALTLAIGQKAAFFQNTPHFVNIVAGGGCHGFDGIAKLAAAMQDAFLHKKDIKTLIQRKGIGCASCL